VRAARIAWLRRLTSGNFQLVPPLSPAVTLPPRVRGDPRWPPVWSRLDDERAVIAVNGHEAVLRWTAALPAHIAAVASGDAIRLDGEDALLAWLGRAGALTPA
jgi:hypothetical protein